MIESPLKGKQKKMVPTYTYYCIIIGRTYFHKNIIISSFVKIPNPVTTY